MRKARLFPHPQRHNPPRPCPCLSPPPRPLIVLWSHLLSGWCQVEGRSTRVDWIEGAPEPKASGTPPGTPAGGPTRNLVKLPVSQSLGFSEIRA